MLLFARSLGLALLLALAPLAAHAAFTSYYAPANWTTTLTGNPPGGGPPVGVDASGAPDAITIYGGDSLPPGSQACWNDDLSPNQRLGCAILFTIAAPANGVVSFNWAYETFDSPYFDAFGFVLDGVITLLADPDGILVQNGAVSVNVLAGQTFGFWLDCGDCGYGGAWATIRGFSAPVPEPGTLALIALSLVAAGLGRRSERLST